MKKLLAASFAMIGALSVGASYAATTSAKFVKVEDGKAYPLVDAEVLYLPCSTGNTDCSSIQAEIKNQALTKSSWTKEQAVEFFSSIRSQASLLKGYKSTRTGINGEINLDCKSKSCLLIAIAPSEAGTSILWTTIIRSKSSATILPSSGISLENSNVNKDLNNALVAARSLEGRMAAGLSYQTFSEATAPFYTAASAIPSSETSKKDQAQKIVEMLSITGRVWQHKIFDHNFVSCEQARNIASQWNNAVGYQEMGNWKGGIFGCIGAELTMNGADMTSIMYHSTLREIRRFTSEENQSNGIPTVTLDPAKRAAQSK